MNTRIAAQGSLKYAKLYRILTTHCKCPDGVYISASSMLDDLLDGMAAVIHRAIEAGDSSLKNFDPKAVKSELRHTRYACLEADGETYYVRLSTACGKGLTGLTETLASVKTHWGYTSMAYQAFQYAYAAWLLRDGASSFKLARAAKRYRFLGPWALSKDELGPYAHLLFELIFFLGGSDAGEFGLFYSEQVDAFYDHHYEVVGRHLMENGVFDLADLTSALADRRIVHLTPELNSRQLRSVVYSCRANAEELATCLFYHHLEDILYCPCQPDTEDEDEEEIDPVDPYAGSYEAAPAGRHFRKRVFKLIA